MIQLTTDTAGALLLDVAEVSAYLNLDDNYSELVQLIQAVQDKAEAYCGRSFTERTLTLKLDKVPNDGVLELSMSPVASITSVKTLTEAGVESTFDSSNYYLADDYRLVFIEWPDLDRDYGGLTVTYVTGDSAKTPDAVKVGMMKALSTIFEHREDFVIGNTVVQLPNASHTFLDSYRKLC